MVEKVLKQVIVLIQSRRVSYSQPPGDPAGHVVVSSTALTSSLVQIKINCRLKKNQISDLNKESHL